MDNRQTYSGYIFLSFDKESDSLIDGRAVKTNSQLKVVDVIDRNLLFLENLRRLERWLESENKYRIVALRPKDFYAFTRFIVEKKGMSACAVGKIKTLFWDMYGEILAQLKCDHRFTVKHLLYLYRVTPYAHHDKLISECLNMTLLAGAYLFDKQITSHIKTCGYMHALKQYLSKQTVDALMMQVVQKGWTLVLESVGNNGGIQLIVQKGKDKRQVFQAADVKQALMEFWMQNFLSADLL